LDCFKKEGKGKKGLKGFEGERVKLFQNSNYFKLIPNEIQIFNL
jgi:hypothetical protein